MTRTTKVLHKNQESNVTIKGSFREKGGVEVRIKTPEGFTFADITQVLEKARKKITKKK